MQNIGLLYKVVLLTSLETERERARAGLLFALLHAATSLRSVPA